MILHMTQEISSIQLKLAIYACRMKNVFWSDMLKIEEFSVELSDSILSITRLKLNQLNNNSI